MVRRIWPGCLMLVLLWGWPAMVMADEGEPAEETEVAEEADSEASEGGEGTDDDAAAASDGAEASAEDEDSSAEQASAVEEIGDDGEVIEGPGGRPLRTDYPGTEESLQSRMDTSRIEGMDVPDGEDPEEVYDLRVRELETQIDDLKERVFRSKSRIVLLKETVLAENLAGSRAIVTFENDLGRGYNMERAIFSVDGARVFSSVDPAELNGREELQVFNGPMAPGTHTISVSLGLRGSGYGVFSYARGYEFDLRFSCQFTAGEGQTTIVTVRSYRGGNALTAHEDRPTGVCHVSMVELNIDELEDGDLPELE